MLSPPFPAVLFAPGTSPSSSSKRIDFVDRDGLNGFSPWGVQALLDACKLNSPTLWLNSRVLFRRGVIVPRSKLTTAAIEGRIAAISHLYPVNDMTKRFGVAAHEREGNLRGFHVLGDDEDIARLWAAMYLNEDGVKGWDVYTRAMCWTAMAPGTVYVPYVDLDEQGLEGEFDRVWRLRVLPTMSAINVALRPLVGSCKARVFVNVRPNGPLWKYSFHIHWPSLGVENVMHWKNFLLSLPDIPKKFVWSKTENGVSWQVSANEAAPIWDLAVYGGSRQLFRGPFCGKNNDAAAVMRPCVVEEVGGVCRLAPHTAPTMEYVVAAVLDARIARWPTGLTMLRTGVYSAPMSSVREQKFEVAARPSAAIPSRADCDIMEFVMPFFMTEILPKYQAMRSRMLHNLHVKGAVVPVSSLSLSKNVAGHSPGVRYMSVEGDTFCEMDEKHVHTKGKGKIGLIVDFISGEIYQTCFACSERSTRFSFLHQKNRIEIEPESESFFTAVSHWGPTTEPHQFLLNYYSDVFISQRAVRLVWVYDQQSGVWRSDAGGNVVVGRLIDELNEKHNRYLRQYKNITLKRQLDAYNAANPDATEEEQTRAVEKLHGDARKFMMKHTPLISATPPVRAKFIEDMRNYHIHREVREMNKFPHFIPMKNKKYVNVFTGDVSDMEACHLFTSCVDAELTSDEGDLKMIDDWLSEISTGDKEKKIYLKRIGGYCFTFLVHDRKFYVLWGGGKNGKGLFKEFIMKISKGPDGFDSRAKNLSQAFWTESGSKNQSPEGATPESYEMMNRTFLYTDDISAIVPDSNKLKRVVGGEESTGRGLYGKPVDIKPKGKVFWTSNFPPAGPGEDNAYWERCVLLPMNTKYLPTTDGVDHARFRFLQDHAKYDRMLELTDAFFTLCVRALTEYYRGLPWDAEKACPAVMGPFPLPPCVTVALSEARSDKLPLAAFVKKHTTRAIHALEYIRVEELFKNYLTYLDNTNERKTKSATTQSNFVHLLATSMDLHVAGGFVEGIKMKAPVVPANTYSGFEGRPQDFDNGAAAGAPLTRTYVEGECLDAAIRRAPNAPFE